VHRNAYPNDLARLWSSGSKRAHGRLVVTRYGGAIRIGETRQRTPEVHPCVDVFMRLVKVLVETARLGVIARPWPQRGFICLFTMQHIVINIKNTNAIEVFL